MQAAAHSLEQTRMRRIAEGIARRVRSHDQIETEHLADCGGSPSDRSTMRRS